MSPPTPERVDDARLAEIEARYTKATEGPWAYESLGEKGDGSDIIGVIFGPDDEECETPLSGELSSYDSDGEPVDYYYDEMVAECSHRNRRPHADSQFIAHARSDIPALVAEVRRLRALVDVEQEVWYVEPDVPRPDSIEVWMSPGDVGVSLVHARLVPLLHAPTTQSDEPGGGE